MTTDERDEYEFARQRFQKAADACNQAAAHYQRRAQGAERCITRRPDPALPDIEEPGDTNPSPLDLIVDVEAMVERSRAEARDRWALAGYYLDRAEAYADRLDTLTAPQAA